MRADATDMPGRPPTASACRAGGVAVVLFLALPGCFDLDGLRATFGQHDGSGARDLSFVIPDGGVACGNGVKDTDETDVDCGGPLCQRCGDGKSCLQPGDCANGICTGG